MMNAPKYTEYLGERARSSGITFLRKKLMPLDEAYAIPNSARLTWSSTRLVSEPASMLVSGFREMAGRGSSWSAGRSAIAPMLAPPKQDWRIEVSRLELFKPTASVE